MKVGGRAREKGVSLRTLNFEVNVQLNDGNNIPEMTVESRTNRTKLKSLLANFGTEMVFILAMFFWHQAALILALMWIRQFWRISRHPGEMVAWHGAEHKVVNAYTRFGNSGLSLAKAIEASRIHEKCGTEYIVCLLPWLLVSGFFSVPIGFLVLWATLVTSLVLDGTVLSAGIQEKFCTKEPDSAKLAVTILAMRVLHRAEYYGLEEARRYLQEQTESI